MIEQHVTSLYLSRRLKELGVPQISFYHWVNVNGTDKNAVLYRSHSNTHLTNTICSAYLASELGEMLPIWNESVKREEKDWVCIIRHKYSDINDHSFSETEADARAKMLIHLIENGHIKVEDLK